VTSGGRAGHEILFEGERVLLRRLVPADMAEFIGLVGDSASLLYPWVRLPDDSEKFNTYVERFDRKSAECTVICVRKSGAIAGTVSISHIIRGPYRRATIGYNAFAPSVRHGYMSEGMALVLRFAFETLRLHRLEADIQPGNVASLSFAENIGFRKEGFSPSFACIDGTWRDHERWAITSDETGLMASRATENQYCGPITGSGLDRLPGCEHR
jgi:ribosomal-protein-alanine N-acetyltransferase